MSLVTLEEIACRKIIKCYENEEQIRIIKPDGLTLSQFTVIAKYFVHILQVAQFETYHNLSQSQDVLEIYYLNLLPQSVQNLCSKGNVKEIAFQYAIVVAIQTELVPPCFSYFFPNYFRKLCQFSKQLITKLQIRTNLFDFSRRIF